jgi:HTH-type transcriptional regulator/antitoxin HigA
MEQNGLMPSDLPEVGNANEVLDILNGKRWLNSQQIRALSERFQVPPAVFL